MVLRKLVVVFACALILGMAAFATAGVPDLQLSLANTIYHSPSDTTGAWTGLPLGMDGTETLSLYSVPNSTGQGFDEMFAPGTVVTDGTINMVVRDGFGVPVQYLSPSDMYIASSDLVGGMVACGPYANADVQTNELGETRWQNPLFAGGWSAGLCVVYINTDALTSNGGLAILFNSSDISGDGVVNLTDAGFFTGMLGGTDYAADFNYDGTVSVQDAGFMNDGLGGRCP